jgi:hypothetical protein
MEKNKSKQTNKEICKLYIRGWMELKLECKVE